MYKANCTQGWWRVAQSLFFSEIKTKSISSCGGKYQKTCEPHFIKIESFHFQTKIGVILNIFECVDEK